MALSQIIKQRCPAEGCGKIAEEMTSVTIGSSKLITLKCGHFITEAQMQAAGDAYSDIVSSDGRKLMQFQIDGVKFMEAANGRAILADEQGLGKTVQALALLKLHPELLPAVIFAKTTIKLQWHHEIIRWCGLEGYRTQVISSGKEFCAPGFNIYVITYDMAKKDDYIFQYVRNDIKTVIIDECQTIKNHTSERAKAVQRVCKNVEHIIPMSGTPIKNNAGEYFTVLNLVRPRMYPVYAHFIERECDSYHNGWGYKVGGLKNPAKFAEDTKDFIIRRTKDEVLKDMPKFSRRFQHVELDGKVKKVYTGLLEELEEIMYDDELDGMGKGAAQIAIMQKMRHITGLSKVPAAADSVREFLESHPSRKILIGTHHVDVMSLLEAEINTHLEELGYHKTLTMHSGLNGDKRHALVQEFRNDDLARVMIASTLAAGEGMDGLQYVCDTEIMLERQWNPANEEQFEARVHRYGQTKPVTTDYMICSETIDEYFTELVEQKRAIVAGALDNKEVQWNESSLMQELAMILITKGKKAWKL